MTEEPRKTILITGTTSGIGRGLLDHFHDLGWRVVGVNRREDLEPGKKYPNARLYVVDITNADAVREFLKKLKSEGSFPSHFLLNAGVNKPDNLETGLELSIYREMMDVNLYGVLTFVVGARALATTPLTFVGISSTSNIAPNPGHYGYTLSKWGIYLGFKFLQKRDPKNLYKTVILGPVRTSITRHYSGPRGLGAKVLEMLRVETKPTVEAVARFALNSKPILRFPCLVVAFYWLMKIAFSILPTAYPGSKKAEG